MGKGFMEISDDPISKASRQVFKDDERGIGSGIEQDSRAAFDEQRKKNKQLRGI